MGLMWKFALSVKKLNSILLFCNLARRAATNPETSLCHGNYVNCSAETIRGISACVTQKILIVL